MIITWRGSQTLMDWVNDFSITPILSRSWSDAAPKLRIHAGYAALVENEMALHEQEIKQHIKDRKIKEVVFTGHSLGGGLANVAHLLALVTWAEDKTLPNEEVDEVVFRCLSFESPMPFVLDGDLDKKTTAVKEKAKITQRNFVFAGDAVPRAYGNLEYMRGVVDEEMEAKLLEGNHELPPAFVGFAHHLKHSKFLSHLRDKFDQKIIGKVHLSGLVATESNYQHLGEQIYYKSHKSKEPEPLTSPEKLQKIDFEVYAEQIKDVHMDNLEYLYHIHGVLPYAMSPQYQKL